MSSPGDVGLSVVENSFTITCRVGTRRRACYCRVLGEQQEQCTSREGTPCIRSKRTVNVDICTLFIYEKRRLSRRNRLFLWYFQTNVHF